MAKIKVPRSEITELLGLPHNVDDATLETEFQKAIARLKETELAAARSSEEQRLRAEDRRLVNAAYADGRIVNRDNWAAALAANRRENRALLASLASGLRPDEQVVVDEELEQTYGKVMARLGIKPPPPRPNAPRTVAAASPQTSPSSSAPMLDSVGIPLAQLPAPVRISKGTPPEQWDDRQRQDALLRRMSPRLWPGTKPPPAQDVWYQPSPNDHSVYVEGEGWQPKPNYQPRSGS
jgi:hypothetical protein